MSVGRSKAKRCGCIFTCLASGAVQLKLVESLFTDASLGAFFRLLRAKGFSVKHVISDNGTNFYDPVSKLFGCEDKTIDEGRLLRQVASLGFERHFNASAASHAGEVWERLICSVLKILTALYADCRLFRLPFDYDLWKNFNPLVPNQLYAVLVEQFNNCLFLVTHVLSLIQVNRP